jgi:hypothetical protein
MEPVVKNQDTVHPKLRAKYGNHEGLPIPSGGYYDPEKKLIFKKMPLGTKWLPPIWNPKTNRWNVQPQYRDSMRDPSNNLFVRLQQTEEGRTLWKLWTDKRFAGGPGKPKGSYAGYNKTQRNQHKAKAKAEAKEIVKLMEKKGFEIPKAEFAREGIETAVEIMRMSEISPKDKLSAARTVLEWTMAKPVAQSEVSIKKAEDFLSLVSEEEQKAIGVSIK